MTFQTLDPQAVSVSSLTRVGSTATVVTAAAHGFADEDRIAIAGADQSEYTGTVVIALVNATTFTYTVSGTPATPATGTITATYVSDRIHGTRRTWRTYATVWGWWRALTIRDREKLQGAQVTAAVTHAIDIRYRTDIGPKQRAVVGSRNYEVESALDLDGRHRRLTVLCIDRQDEAA